MAEAHGNTVQHWRAYVKAYIASQTDTTATIKCETYWQSLGWGYETRGNGSATVNGQGSGAQSFVARSGSGASVTTLVASKTLTVNKGASGYNVWCSGSVSLTGGYHNGTSSAGCNVYVGQRAYYKPRPPKAFAASRVSDTSQKLTWQGDYTGMDGGYPWASVHIDRRTDGGSWVTIANLNWDAVNYTDNSTTANHRYEYRAFAKGAGGTSDYTGVQAVYTTPAAPSSVTLSKVAGTSVRVEAGISSVRTATAYDVESNLNGAGWSGLQTVSSFPVTIDVGGGRAKLRVRSTRGELKSAWTESAEIATITPPLAPALSGLPAVAATGSAQALKWSPNHPDGSAQSSAEVEYTIGSAVKTVAIQGAASTWTVPAEVMAVAQTVGIRVRTKGLHAEWGAWSAPVSMRIAVPPTAFFSSPATDGFIVKTLPLSLEWSVTDSTGVSDQVLSIVGADGGTILSRRIDTAARSLTVGIGDGLVDKSSYRAVLEVRGGSSLSVSAARTFETRYDGPAAPVATASIGSGLSAVILVDYGADPSGSLPAAVGVDVSRVDPDGVTQIARDLLPGQSAIDPLPPLNIEVVYRVTARSGIGTATDSLVPFTVDSQGMEAYNFGRAAERCYELGLDARGDDSFSHSGETFRFALGPDAPHLPMFYPDGDVESSGRHSYVMTDAAAFQALRAEARSRGAGLCWFRDAFGNRAFCTSSMSFGYDAKEYGIYEVSVSTEEVVWEEPSNA